MTANRRQFTRQSLGSLLTFSLLDLATSADAFASAVKPLTAKWLAEVNQLGLDLKDEELKQVEWQAKIEELFAKVSLPELLELVDFDKLTAGAELVDNGARSLRFRFRQIDGVPTKLSFGKQIFALKKGRSVVPHGHNNMATAFLILKGNFEGRHYDRLEDSDDHLIIKPTIDRRFGPAEYSTVSDFRDNIHWFKAVGEPAYIFNIHVLNVNPGSNKPTGRVYLDPDGEKISGGRIRARRLGYKEAHKLYG